MPQQLLVQQCVGDRHLDDHEIPFAHDCTESKPVAGLHEALLALPDHETGVSDQVPVVRDRLLRGELAQRVDGVNHVGLADQGDQLRRRREVTDPQRRQCIHLGKRAEHNEVWETLHQPHAVGIVGPVDKLAVCLVEHHDTPAVDAVEKRRKRGLVPILAGGVVGVAEKDNLGVLVDCGEHRLGVPGEIRLERHEAGFEPGERGHPFVHGIGAVGGNDVVSLVAEGLDEAGDRLIGAVADENLVGGFSEALGQGRAQIKTVAAGIDGNLPGVGGAQQRPHFRRRPAEVLVIVETHQPLDAEAPAELGVGRTRNVRLERPDILRHEAGVTVIHCVRG